MFSADKYLSPGQAAFFWQVELNKPKSEATFIGKKKINNLSICNHEKPMLCFALGSDVPRSEERPVNVQGQIGKF